MNFIFRTQKGQELFITKLLLLRLLLQNMVQQNFYRIYTKYGIINEGMKNEQPAISTLLDYRQRREVKMVLKNSRSKSGA